MGERNIIHTAPDVMCAAGCVLGRLLSVSYTHLDVYKRQGVGRLTSEAIMSRDTKLACGAVIMTTILYVVMQLIVDLAYAFVDPRIKARYVKTRKRRRVTA